MLDYRGIEALYTVLEFQSFEAAAKKLHITQSAVSQRVKGLEIGYGEPLLIRVQPYQLTAVGKQLITHYKKICLLEADLSKNLGSTPKPHIAIALNRDSIETWFLDLISENKGFFDAIQLELIADDQELTIDYLKNGRVSACLSTTQKEILGGDCVFVGNMDYRLVATPDFIEKYFKKKGAEALKEAPAIKFDRNDHMLEDYSAEYFGLNGQEINYYVMPSVRGFKQFIKQGIAYGLIPSIELEQEDLVEIFPQKIWTIPFYWHYWSVQSPFYQRFNTEMIGHIKAKLRYTHSE